MRSLGPPFTDHGPEKAESRLFKKASQKVKFKNCDDRVISNLLTGDETWVYIFEPQRRSDYRQWRGKKTETSGHSQTTEKR